MTSSITRRLFIRQAAAALAPIRALAASTGHNVLMLVLDDMRTAMGCYGDTVAQTPHIDALAKRSLLFEHAYCQQALCGPSRTSLLTGLRPDTTRVYGMNRSFRSALPDAVTLPELFKNAGYHTESIGKVFHGSGPMRDPQSWSVPERYAHVRVGDQYVLVENKPSKDHPNKVSAIEIVDAPDNAYVDGKIAEDAVATLGRLREKPFFLGVGFNKPHLPFTAPRRYWDLYDPSAIPLVANPDHPKNMPSISLTEYSALRSYPDIPDHGPIPEDKIREAMHGYYAATSYSDANVGKVLAELKKQGLEEQTIVVLWGDHGFHLGEQDYWGKTSNFEVSARAPLMVAVPGMQTGGLTTRALVEFVDVYPTIAELCGLKPPQQPALEGVSFRALLDDPKQRFRDAAFTQNPRDEPNGKRTVQGYSMRTDRYRFTEWKGADGEIYGVELYDYEKDPLETSNFAGDTEYAPVVEDLRRRLRAGWREAAPKR